MITFKQFLIKEANVYDLDVFRQSKMQRGLNDKITKDIVRSEVEMEHLYDTRLHDDVTRVLRHKHSELSSNILQIIQGFKKAKQENTRTLHLFLRDVQQDFALVRKLAEVNSIYNELNSRTNGEFGTYVRQNKVGILKMISLYKEIVRFRERYV